MLEFTWDEGKRKLNLRKHDIDFRDATCAFNLPMYRRLDTREDYGEDRWIGLGLMKNVVVMIVFVERGQSIRLISVREALKNEKKDYYEKVWNPMG